jgi:hypothetical protein
VARYVHLGQMRVLERLICTNLFGLRWITYTHLNNLEWRCRHHSCNGWLENSTILTCSTVDFLKTTTPSRISAYWLHIFCAALQPYNWQTSRNESVIISEPCPSPSNITCLDTDQTGVVYQTPNPSIEPFDLVKCGLWCVNLYGRRVSLRGEPSSHF